MKTKIYGIIILVALAVTVVSCVSTKDAIDSDPAVGKGVSAWNTREPAAASAYWEGIKDAAKRDKWLNYVKLFEDGKKALDSTDAIKASNESRLLSACNTALTKFSGLDASLELPGDVREKGANLTAQRVDKLLASEKISDAKKMYNTAVDVYGSNDALATVGKEIDVVSVISSEKQRF